MIDQSSVADMQKQLDEATAACKVWKKHADSIAAETLRRVNILLAENKRLHEELSSIVTDSERLRYVLKEGIPVCRDGMYRMAFSGPATWRETARQAIDDAIMMDRNG